MSEFRVTEKVYELRFKESIHHPGKSEYSYVLVVLPGEKGTKVDVAEWKPINGFYWHTEHIPQTERVRLAAECAMVFALNLAKQVTGRNAFELQPPTDRPDTIPL